MYRYINKIKHYYYNNSISVFVTATAKQHIVAQYHLNSTTGNKATFKYKLTNKKFKKMSKGDNSKFVNF